jgi:hypothetical protein
MTGGVVKRKRDSDTARRKKDDDDDSRNMVWSSQPPQISSFPARLLWFFGYPVRRPGSDRCFGVPMMVSEFETRRGDTSSFLKVNRKMSNHLPDYYGAEEENFSCSTSQQHTTTTTKMNCATTLG